MLHSNCKCFEAIVVTSLSLTQYTCTYMHNIVRPNTQQALSRPHSRGVGWKHKRRNWRRWAGQGNGQHWLGHWSVKDKCYLDPLICWSEHWIGDSQGNRDELHLTKTKIIWSICICMKLVEVTNSIRWQDPTSNTDIEARCLVYANTLTTWENII